MSNEKSLWFYGNIYRILFDPSQQEGREVINDMIPREASVLDVGCGTGKMATMLRESKQCKVVGLDLSSKMINFAQNINRYSDVLFQQGDATNLSDYKNKGFDYAISCKMIHELSPNTGQQVIKELCKVGQRVIVFDYMVPLPGSFTSIIIKAIESTFGRDHLENFKAYLESGGLIGTIHRAGVEAKIYRQIAVKSGCEQIVVLEP